MGESMAAVFPLEHRIRRTALGEVVKQSKLGLKDRHTTAHGNAMGMLVKDRDKP
jgi:hypothetical protein